MRIVLGDFNAKVGREDHFFRTIGKHILHANINNYMRLASWWDCFTVLRVVTRIYILLRWQLYIRWSLGSSGPSPLLPEMSRGLSFLCPPYIGYDTSLRLQLAICLHLPNQVCIRQVSYCLDRLASGRTLLFIGFLSSFFFFLLATVVHSECCPFLR